MLLNSMTNPNNKITKEEFDVLQPRCQCQCNQLIPWKEYYIKHGYPKYIFGHHNIGKHRVFTEEHKINLSKSRYTKYNSSPKITKEEFIRTSPHYCGCSDKEIIEWKEYYKHNGIPTYIKGHQNKGRKWSEEVNKKKIRLGESNHFYGKHHNEITIETIRSKNLGKKQTEETKKKKSLSHKGKKWNGNKNGIKNSFYGKHHTEETKETLRKKNTGKFKGDKNPAWIDGRSFLPYCEKWTEELREKIRELHDRKCFLCGLDEKQNIMKNNKIRKLDVHHIDYDKEQGCNGKKWQLVPLCVKCHPKTKNKKKLYYWTKHITELLKLYIIRDIWNWWDSYISN